MPSERRTLGQRVDIADAVRKLLQAGAALVEELCDRRGLVERGHQLDLRAADRRTAHRKHRFPDALILVDLLVQHNHAEVVVIPRDRGVEVPHRYAHMVDRRDEGRGQDVTNVNLLSGHHVTAT